MSDIPVCRWCCLEMQACTTDGEWHCQHCYDPRDIVRPKMSEENSGIPFTNPPPTTVYSAGEPYLPNEPAPYIPVTQTAAMIEIGPTQLDIHKKALELASEQIVSMQATIDAQVKTIEAQARSIESLTALVDMGEDGEEEDTG